MKTADLDYYKNVAETQQCISVLIPELLDLIDDVEAERKELLGLIDKMIEEAKPYLRTGRKLEAQIQINVLTELKKEIKNVE